MYVEAKKKNSCCRLYLDKLTTINQELKDAKQGKYATTIMSSIY